jgi:orotidine-5'-phosphate decarboxylase
MSNIIVALDFDNDIALYRLVETLDPTHCKLKVGKEVFTRFGPQLVKRLVDLKFDVFLDLKFHDIPNTVAGACKAAADLGVWMVNVHAQGGPKMLETANKALDAHGANRPLLIAVTVLTSFNQEQLHAIGVEKPLEQQVLSLANMAKSCGLDGIVCSALEAQSMKLNLGQAFLLVTPGIRLQADTKDDQMRIMTPKMALNAGSDYLVIGRPITKAQNPAQVLNKINAELKTS